MNIADIGVERLCLGLLVLVVSARCIWKQWYQAPREWKVDDDTCLPQDPEHEKETSQLY